MNDIIMRPTRRCRRCGRLLFSKEALEKGYGCQCEKRMKEEERKNAQIPGQMSFADFWDFNFTESEESDAQST